MRGGYEFVHSPYPSPLQQRRCSLSMALAFFMAVSVSGMTVSTLVDMDMPLYVPPRMAVCQYILSRNSLDNKKPAKPYELRVFVSR